MQSPSRRCPLPRHRSRLRPRVRRAYVTGRARARAGGCDARRGPRALAALVVTVLAFAVGYRSWGFATAETFTQALLYSANSTVSLLRAPLRDLTTAGQVMDIAQRLLGPLFFGLILVSLRGRVKR